MARLNHLIPDDVRENFNQHPAAKWVVLVILLLVIPAVVRKGFLGIQKREISSKGKTYTGKGAVFVGSGFIFSGIILFCGVLLILFGT